MLTEKEIKLAQGLLNKKRAITRLITELKSNKKVLAICEPVHNHSNLRCDDDDTRLLKNTQNEVMQKINLIALNALCDTLKGIEEDLKELIKT